MLKNAVGRQILTNTPDLPTEGSCLNQSIDLWRGKLNFERDKNASKGSAGITVRALTLILLLASSTPSMGPAIETWEMYKHTPVLRFLITKHTHKPSR